MRISSRPAWRFGTSGTGRPQKLPSGSPARNPGDAWTRGHYCVVPLNRRRFDQCGAAIRQALASDPLSPLLYAFAVGLHAACGRGDEALADFRRAVELAPTFSWPDFHAAVAYQSQGRLDEAIAVLDEGSRQGLTAFWADCIRGLSSPSRATGMRPMPSSHAWSSSASKGPNVGALDFGVGGGVPGGRRRGVRLVRSPGTRTATG